MLQWAGDVQCKLQTLLTPFLMDNCLAAETFLASPDILSNIAEHLSRHEAEGLKVVCKAIYATFSQCCFTFRPRLLVVASEANRLVEIDPSSGALVNSVPIRKPGKRASASQWPTVVTLCPYDQHLYVCQYMVRSSFPGTAVGLLKSFVDTVTTAACRAGPSAASMGAHWHTCALQPCFLARHAPQRASASPRAACTLSGETDRLIASK